jgi:hypothetical protein
MKPEFLDYLDHLKAYDKQQHSRLVEASKNSVRLAYASGDLVLIKRLFADYPLYFETQNKTYCAIPLDICDRWVDQYVHLIAEGDFQFKADKIMPEVTASQRTAKKVMQFNAEILKQAVTDLLDPTMTVIKPEIISFFGLNPARMRMLIHYLVYSYWLEVVTVNLGLIVAKYDCDILQLECLHGFSKTLLFSNKKFTPFFIECVDRSSPQKLPLY